jgi:hypothetical protein
MFCSPQEPGLKKADRPRQACFSEVCDHFWSLATPANEADREKYGRIGERCSSDLSDAEWAFSRPNRRPVDRRRFLRVFFLGDWTC